MKLRDSEKMTCRRLSEIIGGKLIGDGDLEISGISGIEYAEPGELTFYGNENYEKYFKSSSATCIITHPNAGSSPNNNQAYIIVERPYVEFVKLLVYLDDKLKQRYAKVAGSEFISKSAEIAESAKIYPGCYIGENVKIGEKTTILPNSVILDDCEIGDNCRIYPNVTIYQETKIGNDCIIHAGAVIGSDGFGYLEDENGTYHKIPQLGDVRIHDNCEIGANAAIDRATVGSTQIMQGVKIDNLVHIAHNCIIGANTGIAAQAGISGSVKIGNQNRLGGQAGVAGHIELGEGVTLLAQSGTGKSLMKKGVYFGSPAKEQHKAYRIEAALRQLPDLLKEVAELKRILQEK